MAEMRAPWLMLVVLLALTAGLRSSTKPSVDRRRLVGWQAMYASDICHEAFAIVEECRAAVARGEDLSHSYRCAEVVTQISYDTGAPLAWVQCRVGERSTLPIPAIPVWGVDRRVIDLTAERSP